MKKMILLQIELAKKEIREAKEIINTILVGERNSCNPFTYMKRILKFERIVNYYVGYVTAMELILRELEERENTELEKMYEEQKNNI